MKFLPIVFAFCLMAPLSRAASDEKLPEKSTPENGATLPGAEIPVLAPVAAPIEAPIAAPAEIGVEDGLAQARISLSLRDAPLLQITKLLELSTPARFRWGAPPDVVVSPQINDKLLLPSLDKLLGDAKWMVRRDGGDLFLLPVEQRAAMWSVWSGQSAPPRNWASPDPLVRVSVNSSQAPRQTASQNLPRWYPINPANIAASRRPAFGVRLSASMISGKEGHDGQIYLRRQFSLSFVPASARLLLAVPGGKTLSLYVNGAPVLRNISGMRMIDLSRALRRGDNVLALQIKAYKPFPSKPSSIPVPIGDVGYEWFFESEPGGSASVQNSNEGG